MCKLTEKLKMYMVISRVATLKIIQKWIAKKPTEKLKEKSEKYSTNPPPQAEKEEQNRRFK